MKRRMEKKRSDIRVQENINEKKNVGDSVLGEPQTLHIIILGLFGNGERLLFPYTHFMTNNTDTRTYTRNKRKRKGRPPNSMQEFITYRPTDHTRSQKQQHTAQQLCNKKNVLNIELCRKGCHLWYEKRKSGHDWKFFYYYFAKRKSKNFSLYCLLILFTLLLNWTAGEYFSRFHSCIET